MPKLTGVQTCSPSRRRHTRCLSDWSSDVCSSDLSWLLLNRNFHGEEVVEFLQYLTRKVPGEWTVVWDGNNIHSKSKAVKVWLAKHPNVVVEDFPGYDPQNNPDEWVWSWAKYGKLCNFCPADVEWLFDTVMDTLEELEHQPTLLATFVMDAGVPLCL